MKSFSSQSDRSSLIEWRIFLFSFNSFMKTSMEMLYLLIHRIVIFWFFWMKEIIAFPKFFGMFFVSFAVDLFRNLLYTLFYVIFFPQSPIINSPFYELFSQNSLGLYSRSSELPGTPRQSLLLPQRLQFYFKINPSSLRQGMKVLMLDCSQKASNIVSDFSTGLSEVGLLKQMGRGHTGLNIWPFPTSFCCICREF